MGDDEQGFQFAEEAFREADPWLLYATIFPLPDRVHTDPRFASLVERLRPGKGCSRATET